MRGSSLNAMPFFWRDFTKDSLTSDAFALTLRPTHQLLRQLPALHCNPRVVRSQIASRYPRLI